MSVATQGVPKMKDANLFIQTRARLQRISDMKFFTGSVEAISHTIVRIKLKASKVQVIRGDRFSVEVAGQEHTAAFIGDVGEITGMVIELNLPRGMALLPKKENARVVMTNVRGRILFEGSEYGVSVVDISDSGLGLLTTSNLERGIVVQFEISTHLGEVTGAGEVKYCRADPDVPGQFRSGIQITALDRIQRARWNQLLNPPIAA